MTAFDKDSLRRELRIRRNGGDALEPLVIEFGEQRDPAEVFETVVQGAGMIGTPSLREEERRGRDSNPRFA